MENHVKVLVVRFSSIGDIVLTTPVVRCLKNQLDGEVELHYVTKKTFEPILRANPYIDKIYTIESSVTEILPKLKEEMYDYIIDLHKNIRSNRLIRGLKVISFTFKKYNIEKWMLVNLGMNKMPEIHLVDRYFQAVAALSVENDGQGLDFFIPKEDEVNLSELNSTVKNGFIALVIGGKYSGKKLPVPKLIEVCEGLEGPIVLMGGPDDVEAAEAIESSLKKRVVNTCGKFNINQSASIISQAKVVITHDTGLMHIAAAFKKDIISVWGATVPEFGMYPYLPGPKSIIVQADHLKYRPTSKLGNRNTKKELRTMEEIDIKRIIDHANEVFKGSSK